MDIEPFMRDCKQAGERRDERRFCALFAADGEHHHAPFAVQRGHAQLARYGQHVERQEDVRLTDAVLASAAGRGMAHRHGAQACERPGRLGTLFRIRARSTGTNLAARQPGDPLPKMVLDGGLRAKFDGGLFRVYRVCRACRLWWHSMPEPA